MIFEPNLSCYTRLFLFREPAGFAGGGLAAGDEGQAVGFRQGGGVGAVRDAVVVGALLVLSEQTVELTDYTLPWAKILSEANAILNEVSRKANVNQ